MADGVSDLTPRQIAGRPSPPNRNCLAMLLPCHCVPRHKFCLLHTLNGTVESARLLFSPTGELIAQQISGCALDKSKSLYIRALFYGSCQSRSMSAMVSQAVLGSLFSNIMRSLNAVRCLALGSYGPPSLSICQSKHQLHRGRPIQSMM